MGLETFGEVIKVHISAPVPSSQPCSLTRSLPWAATRTPSSKHTVWRAGSLTLHSLWRHTQTQSHTGAKHPRCSGKRACLLIPSQVNVKISLLSFSCIIIHLVSLLWLSDHTFLFRLSCFPGFSCSFSVSICPFSFFLCFFSSVYAHHCMRCVIRGDNDCYCRKSARCTCFFPYGSAGRTTIKWNSSYD